jgi:hypothetical protein
MTKQSWRWQNLLVRRARQQYRQGQQINKSHRKNHIPNNNRTDFSTVQILDLGGNNHVPKIDKDVFDMGASHDKM